MTLFDSLFSRLVRTDDERPDDASQPTHRITYEQMEADPKGAAELTRTGNVEVVDEHGERVLFFGRISK